MPIEVGERTVTLIKQLANVRFTRNTQDNSLTVSYNFDVGYFDANGAFVPIRTEHGSVTSEQAQFILGLRPSDGNLDDPSLGQMLVTIFEAIETGALVLPEPESGGE